MALAAVCSKAVVLLLLSYCLLLIILFVGVVFGPWFVMYYFVSFLVVLLLSF